MFENARSILELMAALNEGVNHVCSYELSKLSPHETIEGALIEHLGHQQPIAITQQQPCAIEDLRNSAKCWFFEQEFSPVLRSEVQVNNVLSLWMSTLGEPLHILRVSIVAQGWFYALEYEDLVLQYTESLYWLHFGFSD